MSPSQFVVMGKSLNRELLFLNGDEYLPIRDRQLRQSAVRSHVAKITYASETRIRNLANPPYPRPRELSKQSEIEAYSSTCLPIHPGFGCFRSELLEVLPHEVNTTDLRLFDRLTQITLSGMDIASEIFSFHQVYHFLLPNLVGRPQSNAR